MIFWSVTARLRYQGTSASRGVLLVLSKTIYLRLLFLVLNRIAIFVMPGYVCLNTSNDRFRETSGITKGSMDWREKVGSDSYVIFTSSCVLVCLDT